jgi:hypothetical protein
MAKKMKKSFVILFLSSLLMLSSCSRHEPEDDFGPDADRDDSGESAYFAVNVHNLAGMSTRAEGDLRDGSAAENMVSSLLVVLYDQHNVVQYSWYYDKINGDGVTTPSGDDIFAATTATDFTLYAQKVVRQPYKLLVLVNPTDDVSALAEEGDTYSELMTAVEVDADELTGPAGGFFMSNHQGVVSVGVDDLKESEEEAEQAPVTVRVDRAVAKVSVKQGSSFVSKTANGEGVLMFWGLDVTNKSMYWLRRMTNTVAGGIESEEEVGDPRVNIYAEDPNFTRGYSRAAWQGTGGGYGLMPEEPSALFRYAAEGDINIPLSANATWDYCLENTMVASEQWHDVTTSIIVKARWIPRISELGTPVRETVPGSGISNPYFVFRGKVFTATELDKIVNGTVTESRLPASLVGMQAALADILAAGGVFGSTGFSDFVASAPNVSVAAGELSYNCDGINYYRVPIRHFGNGVQPNVMGYGRFGVVRNNVYELTIRSISGPGRITIPPPEFKDEWSVGFISARLQILPWILRDYIEDIGEDVDEYDYNPPTTP